MAPLPENNTARLWIEYTVLGQAHDFMLRPSGTADLTLAESLYDAFAPLIAACIPNTDAVTGARFSAATSNVSFPIGVASVAGTGGGAPDTDKRATFGSFTGRSADGRDTKTTVFTPFQDPDTTGYRVNTPVGPLAAVLAELISQASNIRTISNGLIFWNPYVNLGFNAYYQRKLRRSG